VPTSRTPLHVGQLPNLSACSGGEARPDSTVLYILNSLHDFPHQQTNRPTDREANSGLRSAFLSVVSYRSCKEIYPVLRHPKGLTHYSVVSTCFRSRLPTLGKSSQSKSSPPVENSGQKLELVAGRRDPATHPPDWTIPLGTRHGVYPRNIQYNHDLAGQ